jgi:hypothetical protein
MKKFGELTEDKIGLVIQKVGMDLLRGVVMLTPVDTGRARANWQASIGSPITTELPWEGGGKSAATQAALSQGEAAVGKVKGDAALFLSNNVPYIEALEWGHSGQAPDGMVRKTIERFPYLVEEAAK